MNDWDPPQVGSAPVIPVSPNTPPARWWKVKYRRVPAWGWAVGGLFVLGGVASALGEEPADSLVSSEPPAVDAGGAAGLPVVPFLGRSDDSVPTQDDPPPTSSSSTTSTTTTSTTTTITTTTSTTSTTTTVPPTTTRPETTTTKPTVATTTQPPTTTSAPRTTTTQAPETTAPVATQPSCDPNYEGACVPIASDVDCAGGSGNGPAYVQGPVYVVGVDIYDLDRDGDGVGCEP